MRPRRPRARATAAPTSADPSSIARPRGALEALRWGARYGLTSQPRQRRRPPPRRGPDRARASDSDARAPHVAREPRREARGYAPLRGTAWLHEATDAFGAAVRGEAVDGRVWARRMGERGFDDLYFYGDDCLRVGGRRPRA